MAPILGIWASSQIAANLSSFESIATVTAPALAPSTISFSSIPSTYKHLQIRGIGRRNTAQAYVDNVSFYFNTDSANTNYYRHILAGDGSAVVAGANALQPAIVLPGNSELAGVYGAFVIDILDYANTNKNKTIRILTGTSDNSGSSGSDIRFSSGLWNSTSAINQITFSGNPTFLQYSSFALYGVK